MAQGQEVNRPLSKSLWHLLTRSLYRGSSHAGHNGGRGSVRHTLAGKSSPSARLLWGTQAGPRREKDSHLWMEGRYWHWCKTLRWVLTRQIQADSQRQALALGNTDIFLITQFYPHPNQMIPKVKGHSETLVRTQQQKAELCFVLSSCPWTDSSQGWPWIPDSPASIPKCWDYMYTSPISPFENTRKSDIKKASYLAQGHITSKCQNKIVSWFGNISRKVALGQWHWIRWHTS